MKSKSVVPVGSESVTLTKAQAVLLARLKAEGPLMESDSYPSRLYAMLKVLFDKGLLRVEKVPVARTRFIALSEDEMVAREESRRREREREQAKQPLDRLVESLERQRTRTRAELIVKMTHLRDDLGDAVRRLERDAESRPTTFGVVQGRGIAIDMLCARYNDTCELLERIEHHMGSDREKGTGEGGEE